MESSAVRPRQARHATNLRRRVGFNDVQKGNDTVEFTHRFHFPTIFQLGPFPIQLSAARSIAFRVLFQASQASDVGSIPIARSINPVDAVGFTGFPPQIPPVKSTLLDASWTRNSVCREFWTQQTAGFWWHASSGKPRNCCN